MISLVATAYSEDEILEHLSTNLNACSQWLTDHRLLLNVAKTKLMFFGTQARTNLVQTESLVFNGGVVNRVDEYKYLGIMLDTRLHFDKHTKYV